MINSQLTRLALCIAVAVPFAHLLSKPAIADAQAEKPIASYADYQAQFGDQPRNSKQTYMALGLGLSQLNPDTSGIPGYSVGDSSGLGVHLTLGRDFSRQFAAELHASMLGTAELAPQGDISYGVLGASGLLFAGKNRHNYKRRGLVGFARLGVGMLHNSPSDGISYQQVNNVHILGGFGVGYNTQSGFGVRAEAIAFDTDATYIQLGLSYRFKRKQREQVEPVAAVVIDSDNDGVADELDRCPTTQPKVSVDATGCALFAGVVEGVTFLSGSGQLTSGATEILEGVAETLVRYPEVKLQVKAHTDSRGSEEANMQLSRTRAESVANYLAQLGVDSDRIISSAYGELQPIASNATAKGREQNRRVELFTIK